MFNVALKFRGKPLVVAGAVSKEKAVDHVKSVFTRPLEGDSIEVVDTSDGRVVWEWLGAGTKSAMPVTLLSMNDGMFV